jgi:hypothetical protein
MDSGTPSTNKKTVYYGGLLVLLLVALYLIRNVFDPVAGARNLYATAMDTMGGAAFNTYVVPDNYYRP